MGYVFLALAIGAEIAATTLIKYSEGFTKLWPSVGCILAYIICYGAFSRAVMRMNLGAAYATWCGVGIVATSLISVLVFKERLSSPGMIGVVLIIAGCILLNLFGSSH